MRIIIFNKNYITQLMGKKIIMKQYNIYHKINKKMKNIIKKLLTVLLLKKKIILYKNNNNKFRQIIHHIKLKLMDFYNKITKYSK